MKRKKVTEETEAQVMFQSNRQCCVCNKMGDHIHHIDGDASNSTFNNLAFLCFLCHNDATVKSSLRRTLAPKTILKYRNFKYRIIKAERKKALNVLNTRIKGLTTEELLTTVKIAVIIIELEKIKDEYFSADWDTRTEVISKLNKFSRHSNYRLAYEIYDFIALAAEQTRMGMPTDVALCIFSTIIGYFPYQEKNETESIIELANLCANISFSLVYDSILYLKNYQVAMYGLLILKHIYKKAKAQKIKAIIDKVNETYNEIEKLFQRPNSNALTYAQELVKHFRKDIEVGTLAFPLLPGYLMELIDKENKIQKNIPM